MMKLLVFPHSHYCEKARWALDYKGLAFEPVVIMPGLHLITVRRYAAGTSVPVLLTEQSNVQGSSEIIDYLEQHAPQQPLTPSDETQRAECLALEHEMDEQLGENLRRILYEHLLAYPDFIRYCFTYSMPTWKKVVFRLTYPVLRRKIYQAYVISPARVMQARQDFDAAMDALAARLNGRSYLIGDQFSRADLSVASMLSLLVLPDEHPMPWLAVPDSEARAFMATYRDHPVLVWARDIYRLHR